MATHYEKLTIDGFKERLKSGKYADLTGARRAIGKTGGWSDKDKEKARAAAEEHFAGATKKGPAKKTTAPAKRGPAKKAAAAATDVPVKRSPGRPKKSAAAAEAVGTSAAYIPPPPASQYDAVGSVSDGLRLGRELVDFGNSLRQGIVETKAAAPGLDFTEALNEVHSIFTRAGSVVSQSLSPKTEVVETLPPAVIAVDKSEKKAEAVETADTEKPPAQPATELILSVKPAPAPMPVPAATPTLEETKTAESLTNARPATSVADLPRPVVSP